MTLGVTLMHCADACADGLRCSAGAASPIAWVLLKLVAANWQKIAAPLSCPSVTWGFTELVSS